MVVGGTAFQMKAAFWRCHWGIKELTEVNMQGALTKGFYLSTELLTQAITQLGLESMISCTATVEQNPSGMS